MNYNIAKRILLIVLVAIMVFSLPVTVFAVGEQVLEVIDDGQAQPPISEAPNQIVDVQTNDTQKAPIEEIVTPPENPQSTEEVVQPQTLDGLSTEILDNLRQLAQTDGKGAAEALNKYVLDANFLNGVFYVADIYFKEYNAQNPQYLAFLDAIDKTLQSQIDEYIATKIESVNQANIEKTEGDLPYVPGEVLVIYDDNASREEIDKSIDTFRLNAVEEITLAEETVVVELPDDTTVEQAIAEISLDENVLYVQPNYIYTLLESTMQITQVNDPDYLNNNQWYLNKVKAPGAWDYSKANKSVKVAVIDSGAMVNHPDLKNNINPASWDIITNSPLYGDVESRGHGTNVSGIIAGQANNGIGIAGVSYNADILAINAFKWDGGRGEYTATTDDILKAYNYAITRGVRVVNLSLGSYSRDLTMENVINYAAANGIVTVCAGGNGDKGIPQTKPFYPADFEACISVVPVDSNNQRAYFADYNQYKDISAPGVSIYSTLKNGYGTMTGSSQAAPIVTGVVALMIAKNPALTVAEVKNILYSTATNLGGSGRNNYYGWGLINAEAALSAVSNIVPVSAVSVASNASSMDFFDTMQFSSGVAPYNATYKTVNWSISNGAGIASISQNGLLTPKGTGVVTVRATAHNGLYGEKTITITQKYDNVEQFVARFYRYCLDRSPDPTGIKDWSTALKTGGATGAKVAQGFVFSPEFQNKPISNTDYVKIMYNAFFGREADASGLSAWVSLLDKGYSRYYIFGGFVNSAEFKGLSASYGINAGTVEFTAPRDLAPEVAAFVTRFYNLCLGRGPDDTGINDWTQLLMTGGITGAKTAEGFVYSKEFQNKNVSNEEYVKIMYAAFFDRAPDSGGYNGWVSLLNSGTDRYAVLKGFTNSTEFNMLCGKYGIVAGAL